MQTVESLNLFPVWLNPGHLVATARVVLQGHRIRALGVVDGERLLGVVSMDGLIGQPEDARLKDVMDPPQLVLEADMAIRRVAELFVESGAERAPVMRGGKFLGIVTASMLLKELRRSWDPLTGLSWSDGLREWGIDALRNGKEIVVFFVDLDDFGEYNKRYGHIVGDKVLQLVADTLKDFVDPRSGILVRYGGDEFAIGMVGIQQEGQELARRLRSVSRDLMVPEAEEPVTFCVGVAGGKRTRERENVHYSSTLDNLINLASQECILQKRNKPSIVATAVAAVPEPEARINESANKPIATLIQEARGQEVGVLSVIADENSPTALTQVVLKIGDAVVSGVHARMGRPVLESVAIATGKALQRQYEGSILTPKMVNLTEGTNGERFVMITAEMERNGGVVPVSGVKAVGRDLYVSVAEATVEAFQSK
jgi:IMP dehydrogenase